MKMLVTKTKDGVLLRKISESPKDFNFVSLELHHGEIIEIYAQQSSESTTGEKI